MKKIGIDIRLLGKQRTGDEAVFFNLTREFSKMDSEEEFELFTNETDAGKLEEISRRLEIENKENFKIISIPSKNRFLWNFWDLPRYFRKHPVDIYLTQYITPFFVPKNIKIATIVHDISFNFFPQFIKKTDLFFLKVLIPMSLKRADKIFGVSEFTKNEIIKFYGIDSTKVDFFHNAVSDGFKKDLSDEELKIVRKKYDLPQKFILYLGTLQPRKNIPFLVECYATTKDRLGEMKLVLVGNRKAHNLDRGIDDEIRKYSIGEYVLFPGFIDEKDKAAVYRLAHAFVFPSLYEGFGIPVLEAFSMGTPVLCADIPSLREVSGEAALLADPRDIDKFSKALYDISDNEELRKSLVCTGYDRAMFFSWKKAAEKIISVFRQLK